MCSPLGPACRCTATRTTPLSSTSDGSVQERAPTCLRLQTDASSRRRPGSKVKSMGTLQLGPRPPPGRHLLVGVDIGGTFTDCVALDRSGRITATKSPSTPGNFAEGMLAAMRMAAERLGLSLEKLCSEIAELTHGHPVGRNPLINRKVAR